jgi:hypothetical protein
MAPREPFIGRAALAAGTLTRHALRTTYVAIHHDVYLGKDTALTAALRAKAAWRRSRGHGILAGFSASALHRAKWITREMAEAGWIVIRVTRGDTEATLLRLIADAWARTARVAQARRVAS